MTRNQIFKSQLYETARHNRALEELAKTDSDERSRSNRSNEQIAWFNANTSRFKINNDYTISTSRLNLDRDRYNSEALISYNRMSKEHEDRQRSAELYAKELDIRQKELQLNTKRARSSAWSSVGNMAMHGLSIIAPYALGASGGAATAAQIASQLFKY